MEYLYHQPSAPRIMSRAEIARVHAFKKRHTLGNFQLFVLLVLAVITPIVIADYADARHELQESKTAYITQGDLNQ